jgi:predicted O-linked N-acetylglucosamine transferase (SPINDLY family)
LFLDTYPCNAHTTASDALWAGLPLLTRAGETFAARVAASLLGAVGLPDLIVATLEQYESTAIELARDADRLRQITQRLKVNRLQSPLFDTPLFTRHLEDLYAQMYERHHNGLSPDHLFVTP